MIEFLCRKIINYVSCLKAYEQVGVMAPKSVSLFPMALDSATPARKGLNFFRTITTVYIEFSKQYRKY